MKKNKKSCQKIIKKKSHALLNQIKEITQKILQF